MDIPVSAHHRAYHKIKLAIPNVFQCPLPYVLAIEIPALTVPIDRGVVLQNSLAQPKLFGVRRQSRQRVVDTTPRLGLLALILFFNFRLHARTHVCTHQAHTLTHTGLRTGIRTGAATKCNAAMGFHWPLAIWAQRRSGTFHT